MINYGLTCTLLQTEVFFAKLEKNNNHGSKIELAAIIWNYKIPPEHANQLLHICFDALLRFKAYDDKYTDSKSACLHSWQQEFLRNRLKNSPSHLYILNFLHGQVLYNVHS